ncbi:hypothetical protein ACUODJ_06830, partial [Escherichia sp. HC-CC]
MQSLDPLFARLSRSKFRSRFRLGMKERQHSRNSQRQHTRHDQH